MRFVFLCAALIAFFMVAPFARAGSMVGTVAEKGSGRPIAAVEVVLRRGSDSTVVAHAVTGSDGRFVLDSLGAGSYLLRASLLGHDSYVRRDLSLGDASSRLDLGTIMLAVAPIAIRGAEVSTARATAVIAPDRNLYLTRDMPGASTGSATDVLRAVPELELDINDRVSLRGSSSVTIQFNGRAAPLKGDALTTFLRQMPANRIERVEVIANPSARFDPEGTAGIVNIVLKDNADLGLSGSVNLSAGQRYSGPGTRIAWQKGPLTMFAGVSGSFSHYDYDSRTERRSLLTSPPSLLSWDVDNRYKGRYGMLDGSIDYAVTKRATFYGTVNGSRSGNDSRARTYSTFADSSLAVTSRFDRSDDGTWDGHTTSLTLGFSHVIQKGRNERSIELMQSDTGSDTNSDGLRRTFVPVALADQSSIQSGTSGYHERSLQMDDTHPVGARGKLELGYRVAERRNSNASELSFFEGDSSVTTPLSGTSDYLHREVFHSGYLTMGSTFGHFSLQVGTRAEVARSILGVYSSGHRYDRDYRSLFPSANAAWDFGKGRTLRSSFSRRIERPSAYQLNPDVPSSDSLNRFAGNPDLAPKYTNSYSVDASWTGSRGTLRLSPYLRETTGNWDRVTRVDAAGVATSTFYNASSVRYLGVGVTVSLRQVGRLGGTANFGVARERHDASNVSSQYLRNVTAWSAGGNLTFKTTAKLDLQSYLRYAPASALAQGRSSAYIGSMLGARYKLGQKAWANLSVNDPFHLAKYSSTTGDATYTQASTTHNRMRGVSGSFTWTWGKPPEQKERKQSAEQPQDAPSPGR